MPPTLPAIVIALLPEERVKDWAPATVALTVLDKMISPTPFSISPLIELSDKFPLKVIALAKEMSPLFVVMVPPMVTGPVPFCVYDPSTLALVLGST